MPPILITGMHRSGTSWVARVLHAAGVHLGTDLLGSEPSNPYGHFEDEHVVALHDRALGDAGLTWKSTEGCSHPGSSVAEQIAEIVRTRESNGRPWGVKDPRLCLFLSEWIAVAPDSHVLVVLRRPDEVVQSLHRRHAQRWVNTRRIDASDITFWQEPDLGLRLWIHYYTQLLTSLDDVEDPSNLYFFDWNDETVTAASLISDLEDAWDLGLNTPKTTRDLSLGNAASMKIEVRDRSLIDEAERVWSKLNELATTQTR